MPKLLFVTDNTVNGRTFANTIKGHDITTVAYGEAQSTEKYGVVVCDLNANLDACMSEVGRLRAMSGFDDIPILVAATDAMTGETSRLQQAGATAILRKPFVPEATLLSIEHSLRPVGVRTKIDMSVVTPFIDATVQVINTMSGTDIRRTDLFLKKSYTMFGDVSGVVGLAGATEGVVVLTFHQDLAFSLVAGMAGCEPDDLSIEDVADGIGEIINMISGNAKAALGNTQHSFAMSLPTVIMGHGHQIAHKKNQPVIAIVFECQGKAFAVQLCVSSEGRPTRAADRTEAERSAGVST